MIRVRSLSELKKQNIETGDWTFTQNKFYNVSYVNEQCKGDQKGDDTLKVGEKDPQENFEPIDDVRRSESWTTRSRDIAVNKTKSGHSIRTDDQDRKIPPKNSWRSFDSSEPAEELNKPPKVPSHLRPVEKPKKMIPEKRATRLVVPSQRWLYLLIVIIIIAVVSYIVNYIYSILTVWLYYTKLLKNKYTTTVARRFLRDNSDHV